MLKKNLTAHAEAWFYLNGSQDGTVKLYGDAKDEEVHPDEPNRTLFDWLCKGKDNWLHHFAEGAEPPTKTPQK